MSFKRGSNVKYLISEVLDEEVVAGLGAGPPLLAGLLALPAVLLGIVGEDEDHARREAVPQEGGEGQGEESRHGLQVGLVGKGDEIGDNLVGMATVAVREEEREFWVKCGYELRKRITCTHTQEHTRTHTHTRTHMHTPHTQEHTRTHAHTHTRTYTHTHVHTHTHLTGKSSLKAMRMLVLEKLTLTLTLRLVE